MRTESMPVRVRLKSEHCRATRIREAEVVPTRTVALLGGDRGSRHGGCRHAGPCVTLAATQVAFAFLRVHTVAGTPTEATGLFGRAALGRAGRWQTFP